MRCYYRALELVCVRALIIRREYITVVVLSFFAQRVELSLFGVEHQLGLHKCTKSSRQPVT